MEQNTMLTWIIPVYNGEKYLAQAIDSILRQPCGDLEILVIDDGSTDGSLKIAQGYDDPRVRAIHKENGGVSSARNLGIENARSRYIAFLDADDVVCKGAYDDEIHGILEEGRFVLLGFSYYCADHTLHIGNKRAVIEGEVLCDETELDPYSSFCALFYRREWLIERKILFPNGIEIAEDVAFHYIAYHNAERIKFIDRSIFVYRNNVTSSSHKLGNYDNVLKHAISAWVYCKNQCTTKKAKDHCDIRIFATAVEYIQMACMAGVPVTQIKQAMKKTGIQEALVNYDLLWAGRKEAYESFIKKPGKFWWKNRIKGLLTAPAHFAARLPGIRSLYMKLKYKERIEHLV